MLSARVALLLSCAYGVAVFIVVVLELHTVCSLLHCLLHSCLNRYEDLRCISLHYKVTLCIDCTSLTFENRI